MSHAALVLYGDLLVLGPWLVNKICRRVIGIKLCSERASWICYTLGAAALVAAGLIEHFWVGVAFNTIWITLGVIQVWIHWDDDDDDWPGPRKLTEWGKRKLAEARHRPIPVPVKR